MSNIDILWFGDPPPTLEQRNFCHFSRSRSGFSLVEIVIALGVTAFALIPLLGLLPTGIKSFQDTMNTAVCTQISQRVINDLQSTSFTNLQTTNRFFDEQGTELTNANSLNCVYRVRVSLSNATNSGGISSILGGSSSNLYTVSILIAKNSGGAYSATNPNTLSFSTLIGKK
jgi:uncharacterized protein (TIGR02598 family)